MRELIKEIERDGFTIKLFADGGTEGSCWFEELYKFTDEHIAGQTIQIPSRLQGRNSPKYVIGQYTPAQLAKDYAKQGRENPSREAYESLQHELGHYLTAADWTLVATVEKAGVELAEVYTITYDYSAEYDDCDLETFFTEYVLPDCEEDAIEEALDEAKGKLALLKEA